MKVDFDQPLTDLDGEEMKTVKIGVHQAVNFTVNHMERGKNVTEILKELEEAEGEPLTLSSVCVDGLLGGKKAQNCSGREKLRRYKLAKKISEGGVITLSTKKDGSFIDDCLAETLHPMAYGAANALLFPEEPEDDDDDEPPKKDKKEKPEV